MVTKTQDKPEAKAKAPRANVAQLTILNAWSKKTSTGKNSIFGQARDEHGQRYQIVCAVEIPG